MGKLSGAKRVVADYAGAVQGLQATSLTVTSEHALKAGLWDVVRRDPFDRTLAAPSALERLALVSGGFAATDAAQANRALLDAVSTQINWPVVEAGLAVLEAGGDFADGVIAF